ncbi:hypothetical protein ETW23_11070 [Leisingera sp. NJS201]|nr:hypothetical protein ETW23_11070 [Leisingera sp. NJS201]
MSTGMGPDIIAATGLKSRVRDCGRVWDIGGKPAEICPIDWSGSKQRRSWRGGSGRLRYWETILCNAHMET